MNQRVFFAAFGLAISSSFKASLGTRHRRPNCTRKLNQLRGRLRFSLFVGATRVGTWRRSSAPPIRFPFCYFSTSYALLYTSFVLTGDDSGVKSPPLISFTSY